LRAEGASAADVAEVLAELKAMQVSRHFPGALVIGADQMLDCEGRWFDKAKNPVEAAEVLSALRGKTHTLTSCAVVVRDGQRLWHHSDSARLAMRPFSDVFLTQYLDSLGARACETVGAYHLEGLGAQLFSRVSGDFFTILGLPLIPLMGFLRAHEILVE
jgi:septum formation protein